MADESTLSAAHHEATDISPRVIWIGVPALIASVIALALLVLWLFPGKTVDRTIHMPLAHCPAPELQGSPRNDLARFRAEQLRWLNGTGWIDRTRGIAHIPIDEAMREVATEGIAGWPAPPPTRRASRSYRFRREHTCELAGAAAAASCGATEGQRRANGRGVVGVPLACDTTKQRHRSSKRSARF